MIATQSEQMQSTLDFLWIELTNHCNLTCVHCYSSSSPFAGDDDVLTQRDYKRVLNEAYGVGCRSVQFIGGEPQLNRSLYGLTCHAVDLEFEYIEIFSNLTRLGHDLLKFAAANSVRFATSIYSDSARSHDAITGVVGSHARTLANIRLIRSNNIELRVGIIAIEQDDEGITRVKRLLKSEGVENFTIDRVRNFGRANSGASSSGFGDLCGECFSGKLCVAPTGHVYPCIMSRSYPVGNVTRQALSEILIAAPLSRFRTDFCAFVTKMEDSISSDCAPRVMKCQPMPPRVGMSFQQTASR
jgi:MoaA/NifB/PqqE/SkfB family radical SAM enzyme